MGIDPKTMYDNMNKKKKKKGSILPLLVVVIIAFLAYQANPEYWQQGKLFQDIKNAGKKKEVETEDIAKIPEKPAEPEVDPDAILDGSIKGAKTIPINIKKQIEVKKLKFNFKNSLSSTRNASVKYLALKSILKSLPISLMVSFSCTSPSSLLLDSSIIASFISNLTRLLRLTLLNNPTRSNVSSSCVLFTVTIEENVVGRICL